MLPLFHYESTKPLSSVKIRETGGSKQCPRQACLLHAPPLWCRARQARAHVPPGSRSKRAHEAGGSLNSHAWRGAFPAALVPPIVNDGGWVLLNRNENSTSDFETRCFILQFLFWSFYLLEKGRCFLMKSELYLHVFCDRKKSRSVIWIYRLVACTGSPQDK